MVQPGYSLLVRRGGEPTAITAEATTVTNSTQFVITSVARRVLDPNSLWHIQVGAATQAYSVIQTLNFVTGEITTFAPLASAPTFYGKYIPITTASDVLLESRDFTLGDSNDLLDVTVFTGTTDRVRKRIMGLQDVDLSVESLASRRDLAYLSTLKFNGSSVVTEVYFGDASLPRFRGFCRIESIEYSGSVEDLLTTNLTFKIAAVQDVVNGSGQVASYDYTIQTNT